MTIQENLQLRCPRCGCSEVEITCIGQIGRHRKTLDPNKAECTKCHHKGNAGDWYAIELGRQMLILGSQPPALQKQSAVSLEEFMAELNSLREYRIRLP